MVVDGARNRAQLERERDLGEQRANAFWQRLIDHGRELRRQDSEREKKLAEFSPPPPAPNTDLHTTPATNPGDIPALFLAATTVLRLINAGLRDGRRFSAAPQAKDRAAWRLVQSVVLTVTDKAAQEVINSWLQHHVLELRDYRDPTDRHHHPGLFITRPEGSVEVS